MLWSPPSGDAKGRNVLRESSPGGSEKVVAWLRQSHVTTEEPDAITSKGDAKEDAMAYSLIGRCYRRDGAGFSGILHRLLSHCLSLTKRKI